MVCTGLGPTSAALGIFEPVTMMRSNYAVASGVGETSWEEAIGAPDNTIPTAPNQIQQMPVFLMGRSFRRLSLRQRWFVGFPLT